MTLRSGLLDKLWNGADPFTKAVRLPHDCTGWNSDHPYLYEAADRTTGLIVEVGCWKGASVVTLAKRLKERSADSCVVAVDTWLGSAEHWAEVPRHPDGQSKLYERFLSNMLHADVSDYVVPLPLDSAGAATLLGEKGALPSAVHLDAAHDYASTLADVGRWWALLPSGGEMIVDDYGSSMWLNVKRATDDFLANGTQYRDFATDNVKCRFRKL